MKTKQILGIGMFILMIGLAYAITMYAGESYTYDLRNDIGLNYINTVSWYFNEDLNLTKLEGINVSINDVFATIDVNPMFIGEFNITFLINGEYFVSVGGGGGGSSHRVVPKTNISECSNWSECDGYFQHRICNNLPDAKVCYVTPVKNQTEPCTNNCGVELPQDNEEPQDLLIINWFEKLSNFHKSLVIITVLAVIFIILLSIKYWFSKKNSFEEEEKNDDKEPIL